MSKKRKILFSLVIIFSLILVTLVALFLSLDIYVIKGPSMSPTYNDGQKVFCWKKSSFIVKKGDVVIIKESPYFVDKDKYFIKRVVATEGDTIAFAYNDRYSISMYMYINEEWNIIDENYIKEEMNESGFKKYTIYRSKEVIDKGITVSNNSLFVMGDNRNDSIDSRTIGLIKIEHVVNCIKY